MTYYPDLAVPGAPEAVEALAELAVANGTRRLVLLSGRGEEEAQRAEEALRESGAAWTILRCSWFSQNFSELLPRAPAGRRAGAARGRGPRAVRGRRGHSRRRGRALTEDGHSGRLYELTGSRLLTFAEAVAEIARASGRELRYVPISMEEFAAGLAEEDVPEDVVSLLTYLFTEVLDGRNAQLNDGVQRALGRDPRDFSDFARRTAEDGVWTNGGAV